MRQANSTIKGYSYQFNKSILEILNADDTATITLEGVIEDIDIELPNSISTIQCKYHEDGKYTISSVAIPILEMLCHYQESVAIGKSISYTLYAYFEENVELVKQKDFADFIASTENKDIQIGYFHRIYTIPDSTIIEIANKPKKSKEDKEKLCAYYKEHRSALSLCVDLDKFWQCFSYEKADKYEVLCDNIVNKLTEFVDEDTARNLYYPNAFSIISTLSANVKSSDRIISKKVLLDLLSEKKSVLINKWTLAVMDTKQILKNKKAHLSSSFSSNRDVRAFVFARKFVEKNKDFIIPFFHSYINKYFKKPKLQNPPIFIFDEGCEDTVQTAVLGLYKYQKYVNMGMVGIAFVEDSFVNNTACPDNTVCKMTTLQNINTSILERCNINQLYVIGKITKDLTSLNYSIEYLDVSDINELKYLISIDKTLEV